MTRFIIFGLPIAFLTACAPAADSYTSQKSSASETSVSRSDFTWPRSYEYMPEGATLIFSATADWRHDSGIAGASAFWARESDENGSGIFTTEHPGVFTAENLSKFDVIIMNSASGNVLSGDQQTAIQDFVENGGGMIAHHAMGDSSLASHWPWWEAQLGTEFVSHPADPQFQAADVVTLAPDHPVMDGIGASFSQIDEWYTFTGPVSGDVIVLSGLDESSYSPVNKVYGVEDLRMGPNPSDHPIIWAKCPGKGKMVYSALGHKTDAFDNESHQTLLRNAMRWVRSDGADGCP
jgi:type 1 glutamine amidotransferase